MIAYTFIAATVAALASSVSAAAGPATCSPSNPCPASTPCCSAYGACGVGAYCLGGCDPTSSHSLNSCVNAPQCKSADYKFNSLSNVAPNTQYLGNTTGIDWVSEGTPVIYSDDSGSSVMLTMAPDTVGTLLSSTHYVWYGKMTAKMKTSAGKGVVTAFIMMSDVKDEIDFEFVGADLQHAQSNYYFQGILNYTNAANLTADNTDTQVHTYEIDWKQDSITWSIDGHVMRTVQKSSTLNSTTGNYDFPQTPSRVMLSLWPAGSSQNGKGTVDWAGGIIDWNSPYMTNGYYHAQVYEVSVECYDVPSDAKGSGSNSYYYTNKRAIESDVSLSSDIDVLGSFLASGENMDYNPNAPKSSGTKTASVALPTGTDIATVPGVVGAGTRGGADTNSNAVANGNTGSSSSSDGSGSSAINVGGGDGTFSQGLQTQDPSKTNDATSGRTAMKGSALAALIAFAAAAVL